MKKRIKTGIVTIAFTMHYLFGYESMIYAEITEEKNEEFIQEVSIESEDNDFLIYSNIDYQNADEYTKKVIENEMENDTGILDEELEECLNRAGILDEEIEDFTDEEINNLENSSEIKVISSYYQTGVNNEEINELNNEGIEEYYKEYYNKHNNNSEKKEKKKKDSLGKSILKAIGVVPIEVEAAAAYVADSDEDYSGTNESNSKFKQTLYICDAAQIDNRPTIYYSYCGTWLKNPYYNEKDYISIKVDNGRIVPEKCLYKFSYSYYTITTVNQIVSPIVKTSTSTPSKVLKDFGTNSSIIYVQELPGGNLANGIGLLYTTFYFDQKFKITGYATMSNTSKSVGQMSVTAHYYHLEKSISVNFDGIGINADGLTLNLSPSITKEYNQLAHCYCLLNVRYK